MGLTQPRQPRPYARTPQSQRWPKRRGPCPAVTEGRSSLSRLASPLTRPLLGGFSLTDFLVVTAALFWNELSTCSIAEVVDLWYFILVYHGTCSTLTQLLACGTTWAAGVRGSTVHTASFISTRCAL